MQDADKALEILRSSDRSYSDLEWLSSYLLYLEDYRKYSTSLPQILKIQLARSLSLVHLHRKQILFIKSDLPTNWYIVFEGDLELFHQVGSENKQISQIPKGKQLGEREILRNLPYTFSCHSPRPSLLLCISQASFITILGDQLNQSLIHLRTFVHSHIPYLHSYSWNFNEKIGCLFTLDDYKRGETVLNKEFLDDRMYFVFEGEAAIAMEYENKVKNVVKLGKGMCFGEECALMGKPSMFCVRVSSERAVIASVRKQDIGNFPIETIEAMKVGLKEKITSRKGLLGKERYGADRLVGSNSPLFRSANRRAREKLMTYILRNRPCTPKRILNLSRIENQNYKNQLQVLRDCSPKRMKASSIYNTHREPHRKKEASFY